MSERFQVVETIKGAGGGAVRMECKIVDTKAKGYEPYASTEFDEDENRYVKKSAKGQWVGDLRFNDPEHAACMAAALNYGDSVSCGTAVRRCSVVSDPGGLSA